MSCLSLNFYLPMSMIARSRFFNTNNSTKIGRNSKSLRDLCIKTRVSLLMKNKKQSCWPFPLRIHCRFPKDLNPDWAKVAEVQKCNFNDPQLHIHDIFSPHFCNRFASPQHCGSAVQNYTCPHMVKLTFLVS
jgi:hypothetical protein